MRFLYDLAFFVFALFYLPLFFAKGKFNRASLSRLGRVPAEVKEKLAGGEVLWLHAVSVGEVGVAVSFLNRMREDLKGVQVLLTTTTVAGHEVAAKIKNEEDALLFFPADLRFAVRAFVDAVRPSALVLFETEIWPNVIAELSDRGVPVVIANGRISDRAFKKYLRVRGLLKGTLRRLDAVGAQDERMRERFTAIGADPQAVSVTGNLKFDWTPPHAYAQSTERLRRACRSGGEFLWVAGSTHAGEEEMLFSVYSRLAAKYPGLRLLIAPRHILRLDEIEKAAAKAGVAARRISSEREPGFAREVWLLDQMGVLAALYEACDAAFVGGSLVPVGGHNLVEPAYYEKPVLFGPHMQNFLEMAREFKESGAGLEVADAAALEKAMGTIIEGPERRVSLGKAAKRLVERHQGATERNKALLFSHWQPGAGKKLKEVMG